MMKVKLFSKSIGDVMETRSRRGQVQEMSTRGNANVVDAMVPLANMFGYVNLDLYHREELIIQCNLIIMKLHQIMEEERQN